MENFYPVDPLSIDYSISEDELSYAAQGIVFGGVQR